MRRRVYLAYLTCWVSFFVAVLVIGRLLTMPDGRIGWQVIPWVGALGIATSFVLNRVTRCPFCGARLLRPGGKPEFDRFAYIRCQSCRKRFDGQVGPADPEISDEAIAGGNPLLLQAYRDESAELQLLNRARTDPELAESCWSAWSRRNEPGRTSSKEFVGATAIPRISR